MCAHQEVPKSVLCLAHILSVYIANLYESVQYRCEELAKRMKLILDVILPGATTTSSTTTLKESRKPVKRVFARFNESS